MTVGAEGGATSPVALRELARRSDAAGLRLIGHHDLAGHGDGMQVVKHGDHVYVAHVGQSPIALSILDCSDPTAPRLVRQLPHPPSTHRHKVQIVGEVMIQNSEFPPFGADADRDLAEKGLCVFDLADPEDPQQIGFHPVAGPGVHRIWYSEAPYAHLSASVPGTTWGKQGYQIVDLSDPANPRLVAQWSMPEGDERWPTNAVDDQPWYEVHGAIPCSDRAYVSCEDAGMAILDISDPTAPTLVSHLPWTPPRAGMLHTSLPLPGRGLVVAVEEALLPRDPADVEKRIWLVDVSDERAPAFVAPFPVPQPRERYLAPPGRFGPHNVHENRPGSFVSEERIYATYFNAGVRVYDIADPHAVAEIGHYVPPVPPGCEQMMLNDLYVDVDELVFVTERVGGGLYVLASDTFEGTTRNG